MKIGGTYFSEEEEEKKQPYHNVIKEKLNLLVVEISINSNKTKILCHRYFKILNY
jgi:hypothetical protein